MERNSDNHTHQKEKTESNEDDALTDSENRPSPRRDDDANGLSEKQKREKESERASRQTRLVPGFGGRYSQDERLKNNGSRQPTRSIAQKVAAHDNASSVRPSPSTPSPPPSPSPSPDQSRERSIAQKVANYTVPPQTTSSQNGESSRSRRAQEKSVRHSSITHEGRVLPDDDYDRDSSSSIKPGALSVRASITNEMDATIRTASLTPMQASTATNEALPLRENVEEGLHPKVDDESNPTSVHEVTEASLVDPTEREAEAERIREETLNEVKSKAVVAEVVDEGKRRVQKCIWLFALVALLVTVAVTVTVALMNRNDGSAIEAPTRLEAVTSAVREEFGPKHLDDETSAQYIAIDWMAINDTLLEYPLETEAERRAFRQRYAMCVLAFATNIDTWVRESNWLDPVDECTWSGLTCNDNNELVAINTPNRNLTGTLPTELGTLSRLRYMFVYDNPGLSGSLPSELGSATSLELLHAQDCALTGTIPTSFEGLSSLEKLVLARNDLSGELPVEITRMLNIDEMDLSQNNFTGQILPKFWHLQKLQVLLLNDNSFTGSLSPNFGDLALLRRLEIQNNFLTGVLPTQLGNLRALQSLRTFGNSLNVTAIPDQICSLRRDPPAFGLQVLEVDCFENCSCCTPCS